ncbi:hypothetical protein BDQ17DRAFT_1469152, partial [Cyathus striatus]
ETIQRHDQSSLRSSLLVYDSTDRQFIIRRPFVCPTRLNQTTIPKLSTIRTRPTRPLQNVPLRKGHNRNNPLRPHQNTLPSKIRRPPQTPHPPRPHHHPPICPLAPRRPLPHHLADDLMYMTYKHQYGPQREPRKIRLTYDPEDPYSKFRRNPPVGGTTHLARKPAPPSTPDNVIRLEKVALHIFAKEAVANKLICSLPLCSFAC